jgi:PAS domain S-box-containing protein
MAPTLTTGMDGLDALGRARIVRTLRFLLALAVVGAAYPAAQEGDLSWRFWTAACVLILSNLAFPIVRRNLFASLRLPAVLFLLDMALLGFLFYELGERTGEFYVLFAVALLVAAVTRGMGGVLAATAVAGVLYSLLAAHGKVGVPLLSMAFLTRLSFFFAFTLFVAHLAAEADRARRAIRASEAAAEESRRSLEGVVDLLPTLVTLQDGAGRLVLFNRACERLTGYPRDQVLGRSALDVLVPAVWQDSVRRQPMHPESSALDVPYEIPWRTKAGTERQIEWRYAAIPTERDRLPMILGLGRDVTDARRHDARFAEARTMDAVGRLAKGTADGFNDLLAALAGFGQLGLRKLEGEHPVRPVLEEILAIVDRGAVLTRRLLVLGSTAAAAPVVMDLNAHITRLERPIRRILGEGIGLRLVTGSGPLRVKADPGLIEQAVLNLATRARDGMPDGGELVVETAAVEVDEATARRLPGGRPGPYVRLEVTDTGRTLDAKTRAHLFEPYHRDAPAADTSGMGLAVVYGIVRQAEGLIEVEDDAGPGNRFRILLPRIEGGPVSGFASRVAEEAGPEGG